MILHGDENGAAAAGPVLEVYSRPGRHLRDEALVALLRRHGERA